jgi:hypothetical protein
MCFKGMLLLEPRASTAFFKFSEEWLASEPRQTCRVSAFLLKEDARRFPQLSRSWKVSTVRVGMATRPSARATRIPRIELVYCTLDETGACAIDAPPETGKVSNKIMDCD